MRIPFIFTWLTVMPHVCVALKLTPVVSGLNSPVDVVVAPGEPHRLYVVEQEGRIRIVDKGKLLPEPFLDVKAKVKFGGEMGLLSLAFSPNFHKNRRYYINYTTQHPKLRTVVAEYMAGAVEGREILSFEQPFSNHNGGQLAFDREGYLYIGTGDGGSAGDPLKAGQDPNTLLGKILRIQLADLEAPKATSRERAAHGATSPKPNHKPGPQILGKLAAKDKPYTIPKDNPFANGGGRPEVYALGLRNPWRFSFDSKLGALFAADVGQDEGEEINRIEKGGNYGWNVKEGSHCYEPREGCQLPTGIDPIFEYSHSQGLSITGGFVYRGIKIEELKGSYLYGDFVNGRIWALKLDEAQRKAVANTLLMDTRHLISSFGVDAEQEILVVDHRGAILRLDP